MKAHLLLALLYMEHGDYTKAGKSLFKVLQIDNNNEKATRYMEYVKSRTGKAEVEKRKMKNAFSHREMQDDDVILPPTYKENTGCSPSSTSVLVLSWVRSWSCSSSCRRGSER